MRKSRMPAGKSNIIMDYLTLYINLSFMYILQGSIPEQMFGSDEIFRTTEARGYGLEP